MKITMSLAEQPSKLHIVHIDPSLTEVQTTEAINRLYESHARVPITKPVSISLSPAGGYTFDEGNIAGMTAEEVANRFDVNLRSGNLEALMLNEILLPNTTTN